MWGEFFDLIRPGKCINGDASYLDAIITCVLPALAANNCCNITGSLLSFDKCESSK